MKKNKYLDAVIISLCLLTVSCKKEFLDNVNDNGTLIRQDYVTDLRTTNEYLQGVYISIGYPLIGNACLIYPELIADNVKPAGSTSGTAPLIFLYNWEQQPDEITGSVISTNANANGISYDCFYVIRNCNFTIEKANEYRAQNPELASSILGQAYGIRALVHFFLVNYFAQQYNFTVDGSHSGVPYITSSNITDLPNERNSLKEVYELMIEDLEQSLSLPILRDKSIYFTHTSAEALLSRIYLNMGDFDQAKNRALRVIQHTPLMTVNYPEKLFTAEETEAIFQVPPSGFGSNNNYSTTFPSFYLRTMGYFHATGDIADLLNEDPNDKRKVWVQQNSVGNWDIVKYPEDVVPGIDFPSMAYYQTLIRSSEMYLIAAEAYAQLGITDSAQYYVDQIRLRANPVATVTTATGPDLLNVIQKERRKELAFEGFRMFDLLRWKMPVVRQDVLPGSPTELPYPSNKAIAPIPLLDVQSLGLQQNTGY